MSNFLGSLHSHIPFILLSAKTGLDDQLSGIESGATDYITKPFNVKLLKAKIDNILEQRRNISGQASGFGNSELNIDRKGECGFTTFDDEFLKHITDIVYSNIENSDLMIDDIVSETAMSRTVFYKKIKSLTGLSPVEFVRELKMKKAAHLIVSEQYMIKEIAYMVGFTDLKYFSRCFKQTYGIVPSEYRKQNCG